MNPVAPAELSAYLDGELEVVRSREVTTLLARDPILLGQLHALRAADDRWRAAAGTAVFSATVQLPARDTRAASWLGVAMLVVVLLAVRMLPKLSEASLWGVLLHGIALVVVLVWVARTARAGAALRWLTLS